MLYVPSQTESILVIIKIPSVQNLRMFQESSSDGQILVGYLIEIFQLNIPKVFHLGLNKTDVPPITQLPNTSNCAIVTLQIKGVKSLEIPDKKIEIADLLQLCKKFKIDVHKRYLDQANNVFAVDIKINTRILNRKTRIKSILL